MSRFRLLSVLLPGRAGRHAERGQAIVLLAFGFIIMALFIGLAIDMGILFVTQAHVRRAVDAASLAAASQMRAGRDRTQVLEFARQYVELNNIAGSTIELAFCIANAGTPRYQETPGVWHEPSLCTNPPTKKVRVEASSVASFTFLNLIGISSAPVTVMAISEAASIDLVIVLSTGNGMGVNHPQYFAGWDPYSVCAPYDGPQASKNPNNRNSPLKCSPLWEAKQAAKALVNRMYPGSDRVAIVSYDASARASAIMDNGNPNTVLAVYDADDVNAVDGVSDSTGIYAAIDSLTVFRTSNFPNRLSPATPGQARFGQFNPLNAACVVANSNAATDPACNQADLNNTPLSTCVGCGMRVAGEILKRSGRPEAVWVVVFLSDGFTNLTDAPIQTRTGQVLPLGYCRGGIQTSANPPANSAWGLWNNPACRNGGFYDGTDSSTVIYDGFAWSKATTPNPFGRLCGPYHAGANACPPGALFVGAEGFTTTVPATRQLNYFNTLVTTNVFTGTRNENGLTALYYSAEDYARDMVDLNALTIGGRTCRPGSLPNTCISDLYNYNEAHEGTRLTGAPIALYTIGLGLNVTFGPDRSGELLLRYMAAVGDDGDRVTDPCILSPGNPVGRGANCGNYYFAPDTNQLVPIFEDIARRIFTRLTR